MPATFLYTLVLGIIYLVKKNWNTIPFKWGIDPFKEGKKRLNRDAHQEANSGTGIDCLEENTALKEVVAELV